MNKRPNTRAIEVRAYSRGIARLTRDSKGLYYVEVDLLGGGLYQSTEFDKYEDALKRFEKAADLIGDLSGLMYVDEYRAV